MHIEIDPIIGTAGLWAEGARRGNLLLEQMVGEFSDKTLAHWTIERLENRLPQLTLELAVSKGSARASFSDADLADGKRFWWQLHDVWNDALKKAFQKSMERLDHLLREEAVADHAR